jgi:hypothetical protein
VNIDTSQCLPSLLSFNPNTKNINIFSFFQNSPIFKSLLKNNPLVPSIPSTNYNEIITYENIPITLSVSYAISKNIISDHNSVSISQSSSFLSSALSLSSSFPSSLSSFSSIINNNVEIVKE